MQEMPLTWVQPLSWKDTQEKEMLIHSSILAWKICKEADTTELLLLLLLSRFSRVQLCATPETAAHQAPLSLDSPGKNTGVGSYFLLQRIFPTQGSNLCLLHWATWEAKHKERNSMD